MTLKASRYNLVWKSQYNFYLAYNSLSNTFARLRPSEFPVIQAILRSPNSVDSTESFTKVFSKKLCHQKSATIRPKDHRKCSDAIKGYKKQRSECSRSSIIIARHKHRLLQFGFLINKEIDELEVMKFKNRISRFSKDHLALTVAPTLDCNFRCTYCFENLKAQTMTREVEEALVQFVDRKLNITRIFSVNWFGGEPLLCLDIIERLTNRFRQLCEKHQTRFAPAHIVTNGYFLDRETAERLKALNVTNAQVTIDGPARLHDQRRKHKDGHGTFDRLLENIQAAMDVLDIHVRVNLDKDNTGAVPELIEHLKARNIYGKVHLYFAQVVPTEGTCADIAAKCYTTRGFSQTLLQMVKQDGLRADYPVSFDRGVCCADKLNGFAVAPDGSLFKCWSEISAGADRAIGSLLDTQPDPVHLMNLVKYMNWDPFTQERCCNCLYLPICGGGCPHQGLAGKEACTSWKYQLKEMLENKYAENFSQPFS